MQTKNIILTVVVTLLFLFSWTGCFAQANVDQITENILQAMNDDNYTNYARDFDEPMKKALPESRFKELNPAIKAKIGTYVSKEFLQLEQKDQYTVVSYKAKFSQEPDGVIVRSVFSTVDGKMYVSGFWLDSPNLRR